MSRINASCSLSTLAGSSRCGLSVCCDCGSGHMMAGRSSSASGRDIRHYRGCAEGSAGQKDSGVVRCSSIPGTCHTAVCCTVTPPANRASCSRCSPRGRDTARTRTTDIVAPKLIPCTSHCPSERLVWQLELREPSDESFEAVSAFAGKTGDLRSLSRVDLRVCACADWNFWPKVGGSEAEV